VHPLGVSMGHSDDVDPVPIVARHRVREHRHA
jgi:hypothetical protein